jgi:hypothetical protein
MTTTNLRRLDRLCIQSSQIQPQEDKHMSATQDTEEADNIPLAEILANMPAPMAEAIRFSLGGLRPDPGTITPAADVLKAYNDWCFIFGADALDRVQLHGVLKSFDHHPVKNLDGVWVYNGIALATARHVWLKWQSQVYRREIVCDEGAAALSHLHELIERGATLDELKAATVHTKAVQERLEETGLYKSALAHLTTLEAEATTDADRATAQEARAALEKPVPWPVPSMAETLSSLH